MFGNTLKDLKRTWNAIRLKKRKLDQNICTICKILRLRYGAKCGRETRQVNQTIGF